MSINKIELFESTKARWPTVINLDGMLFNGKQVRGMQILNELYSAIEASIDVNDHWHQLAIWAFHQALAPCARYKLNDGGEPVHPQAVAFEDFEQKMCDNLWGDDCWAEERKIWD